MYNTLSCLQICCTFLFILVFFSCKKDPRIISNNTAPYYDNIPTVLVQSYVNRIYVDLIGREPTDAEMDRDVAALRDQKLSLEAREVLIQKIQTDSSYLPGDSSYSYAYFHRLYEMNKIRIVGEGADDGLFLAAIDDVQSEVEKDSISGDSIGFALNKRRRDKLVKVLQLSEDFRRGKIEWRDVLTRLIDNKVYDDLNMGSFNFVRSTFNNLLFRYPTQAEFNSSFDMVEYGKAGVLFAQPAQSKGEYIHVLVNSYECYEGVLRWAFKTYLVRDASANEIYNMLPGFYQSHDFHYLLRQLMKTDEYANFK